MTRFGRCLQTSLFLPRGSQEGFALFHFLTIYLCIYCHGRCCLEDTVCAAQLALNEGHVLAAGTVGSPLKISLDHRELLYLRQVPPKTSFPWSTWIIKDLDSAPKWGCSGRGIWAPGSSGGWQSLSYSTDTLLFDSLPPTGVDHMIPSQPFCILLHSISECASQGGQLITFVLILDFTLAFFLSGNIIG